MGRSTAAGALAALVAAVAVAGCGGDNGATPATTAPKVTETTQTETTETTQTETIETTPKPKPKPSIRTITIVVKNGRPRGGIARPTVKVGERVRLRVRSDVAEEVHVHGYDISRDVAAGGTAVIVFNARLPGRFEIELEHSAVQLAELSVTP